jgi:hypothetical protein
MVALLMFTRPQAVDGAEVANASMRARQAVVRLLGPLLCIVRMLLPRSVTVARAQAARRWCAGFASSSSEIDREGAARSRGSVRARWFRWTAGGASRPHVARGRARPAGGAGTVRSGRPKPRAGPAHTRPRWRFPPRDHVPAGEQRARSCLHLPGQAMSGSSQADPSPTWGGSRSGASRRSRTRPRAGAAQRFRRSPRSRRTPTSRARQDSLLRAANPRQALGHRSALQVRDSMRHPSHLHATARTSSAAVAWRAAAFA